MAKKTAHKKTVTKSAKIAPKVVHTPISTQTNYLPLLLVLLLVSLALLLVILKQNTMYQQSPLLKNVPTLKMENVTPTPSKIIKGQKIVVTPKPVNKVTK